MFTAEYFYIPDVSQTLQYSINIMTDMEQFRS